MLGLEMDMGLPRSCSESQSTETEPHCEQDLVPVSTAYSLRDGKLVGQEGGTGGKKRPGLWSCLLGDRGVPRSSKNVM